MKIFRFSILLFFSAIILSCAPNESKVAQKQDAPVGCRSYHDVYGPVKTVQYLFEDGTKSSLTTFDENGMDIDLLKNDKEYLELNQMPESESTLTFEDGKLVSFGFASYIQLKYKGRLIEEAYIHPSDLGPAYSPTYYIYDGNNDRIAMFSARFEPNYSEDFKENLKTDPYMLYCDPNLLVTKVERYEILKWDDHGNWIERKVVENGGQSHIDKRELTYFE